MFKEIKYLDAKLGIKKCILCFWKIQFWCTDFITKYIKSLSVINLGYHKLTHAVNVNNSMLELKTQLNHCAEIIAVALLLFCIKEEVINSTIHYIISKSIESHMKMHLISIMITSKTFHHKTFLCKIINLPVYPFAIYNEKIKQYVLVISRGYHSKQK